MLEGKWNSLSARALNTTTTTTTTTTTITTTTTTTIIRVIKDTKQVGGEGKTPPRRFWTILFTDQTCSQQFPFLFVFKETSGQPKVS